MKHGIPTMNLEKPKRQRDEKYLAWIRKQKCLVHRRFDCAIFRYQMTDNGVDAHHVREKGKGGVGTKPNDRRAVPLCRVAHDNYHANGRDAFETGYELDLEAEIKRLNAEYSKLNRVSSPQRKASMRVRLKDIRIQCDCGKLHAVPRGKIVRKAFALDGGYLTIEFLCVTRNERKEVQI